MATNKSTVKAYVNPFIAKLVKAEAAYDGTSESKTNARILKEHYAAMSEAKKADLLKALD